MSVYTGSKRSRGNPEYVVARVRSRRSMLYDESDYRKLVRMGTGEIARFMEDSEYEAEMNALGTRFAGVDLIEYAIERNLAKHFEDILGWSEGRIYDFVARYLRKFDAWNVKTVIRGIYSGADAESIETDLIRAGEIDEETLAQLTGADSIERVVEILADTIYGPPLEAAYEDYERTDLLVPLENAVDRAFYEALIEDLPAKSSANRPTELYIEFLETEIDFRNLRNAIRVAHDASTIDPTEYAIAGGRLFDVDDLTRLGEDREALIDHVRESSYGTRIETALGHLESGDRIEFENALDAALLEQADRLSNRYPVSVCPILAYILAKEREVENIRAIARGREAGMSDAEIERRVIL
ncbi:V-type ATP synthase subunit C [Halococcoides cellulosivorans]|uniref:A-type ATP synthase subunit C n=1 Tax=Halococcoides cellulosivorans TaxID=1679096 RepID=A0A2R4X375_9EURY|nr:V-type ATP synthase subunit C [Halococcoides cellulosivorans]AWB28256.1 V-type ATP synthase subunit C [Halococcoides cellulosivorans]